MRISWWGAYRRCCFIQQLGVGCGKGGDTTLSAEALLPPLKTLSSNPRQTLRCRVLLHDAPQVADSGAQIRHDNSEHIFLRERELKMCLSDWEMVPSRSAERLGHWLGHRERSGITARRPIILPLTRRPVIGKRAPDGPYRVIPHPSATDPDLNAALTRIGQHSTGCSNDKVDCSWYPIWVWHRNDWGRF